MRRSPLLHLFLLATLACGAVRSVDRPIPDPVPGPAGEAAPVDRPRPGGPRAVLGPMIGHTTDRSVRIWVQADRPGLLEAIVAGPDGDVRRGVTTLIEAADAAGVVEVGGLDRPETDYTVRLLLDGEPLDAGGPIVFRTFPPPGRPARLRIALVSCARVAWDSVQPIWRAVAADRPDIVLWLGDNNYFEPNDGTGLPPDWSDPARMAFKYAELRGLPTLRPILRSAAHYAIWDDHDYADGEPDRTFALREEVARLFERFWANPAYGLEPGLDGIYSSFRVGDVEVFLTDDRFFRDPEDAPDGPAKEMLGRAQMEWLQRGLERSRARVKVVAVGVQVLADYHRWDGWHHYRWERARLLDWIRTRKIDGVVFVSGDRHLSELMRWTPPAGGYPLYELTASPIGNRVFTGGLEIPNPIRVGGYDAGYNYGLLDIDTAGSPPTLVFRLKDETGSEVFRHAVRIDDLTFGRSPR